MSPNLKPLLLPRLVEQRRQHDTVVQQGTGEGDQTFVYYSQRMSSSSSDLASPSPETPTFSRSHSRYSGSTSSLEQLSGSSASSSSECPASPVTAQGAGSCQTAILSKNSTKSLLPDVQEDPLREEEEVTPVADNEIDSYNNNTNNNNNNHNNNTGLYDCLCDEQPCIHHDSESVMGGMGGSFTSYLESPADMDSYYDIGFFSDGDIGPADLPKKQQQQHSGADSPLGRIGARLSGGLSRWKSTGKRSRFTFSPASEAAVDQVTGRSRAASRAASSRSSSISALARHVPDRSNEPPLPPTPAMSFYESTDSIALTSSYHELHPVDAGKSLERERNLAATPLLPPLLTENLNRMEAAVSPLQSPTVANPQRDPMQEVAISSSIPLPLSSKTSISSFHPGFGSGPASGPSSIVTQTVVMSPLASPMSELASPMPNMIERDEWSDQLGHANFTIMPCPYHPATIDLDALNSFCADWDQARVNFTRHLCRTGEHYGTTSNTYQLTQAKWADTERRWLSIHDELIRHMIQSGHQEVGAAEQLRRGRQDDIPPSAIPRMLEAEGKFPERGDVDIVGPMQRDAVMIRDLSPMDDRRNVSTWLKSLVGKVGLRK